MAERNLYLTNVQVDEALSRFQEALGSFLQREEESIDVIHSLGRITGEAVYAKYNSPLYDSAAMDGVAVISANTRGASESTPLTLEEGKDYLPVDTGDPVRQPYDAVIMAEDIEEGQEGSIVIRAAAPVWQHIRPIGEDIAQGEMILPSGHTIRPIDIGVLLSGGITHISVYKRPSVAILPTGTELIEPGEEIVEGSIIESNSRMMEAMVSQCGGEPVRFSVIPDEYDVILDKLREACEGHDMVLISAGTSAGREDYTVHALRELGEVIVHGVAMKPGKPVVLAVVDGKPVVGVPGYPVSAYLAFENFVTPILALKAGRRELGAPVVQATLTRRLVSSLKNREYVRVKVGRIGDKLVASPLSRGAGAAMSLVRADGFCVIGQESEGLEAGTTVEVVLSCEPDELEHTVVCIGSHDLILDVLADLTPRHFPGVNISSAHVGSMAGLLALKNGEAHIAPTHLLDEATGIYNTPTIKQVLPGQRIALVKGVGRVQGIMVKKGNPLDITGIHDLLRCRYINRQRGAGTRVLLDYQLSKAGISPSEIQGYDREAATHMAVAAAVEGDSADAGLGVLSAAKAMDLDFIPIGDEEYDFAIPAAFLEQPHIQAFLRMLESAEFRGRLEELGGYTTEHCGKIEYIE